MPNIVTDYHAVADGQWSLSPFTISAGSNALSCTTALWVPGDNLKGIYVPGTGMTTITGVSDSKHITIATAASNALSATNCIVSWGTDNVTAFNNFTAEHQGQTVTLDVPAGIYYVSYANPLFDGISDLTINGAGASSTAIALGIANITALAQYQFGVHSARTHSVQAGATSVTLSDPTQVSLYTVGQYALMTGYTLQSGGFPTNHHFFQYVFVTAIDSNPVSPTYGKITFSAPLKDRYLSTWPLYNAGDPVAGQPDCAGPATLYAWNPSWNASFTFNDLTFVGDAEIGSSGRSVTFNRCTFPAGSAGLGTTGSGPFPSGNLSWTVNDCDLSACTMEVDKYIDSVTINNSSVKVVFCQSSSVNLLTINGSTILNVTGTPKKTVITNSTITGQLLPGPAFAFGRADELICTNCVINQIGSTINGGAYVDKGASDGGINNSPGVSMSGGVITFPNNYEGVGVIAWAVPGTVCFWSDENGWAETTFRVLAVTQDASNTYVTTNLKGTFLPPAFNATKIFVFPHPAPKATFTGCTGTDGMAASLSNAPPRAPLFSYQQRTYTGATAHAVAQPKYFVWGNLVSLSINVTTPYTGAGTQTFSIGPSWPYIDSNNSHGISPVYDAAVNTKIAGNRLITLTGVTGAQSLDTGLAVGDALQTWFTGLNVGTGPAFSADLSGAVITVTFQTDQGFPRAITPLQFRLHA